MLSLSPFPFSFSHFPFLLSRFQFSFPSPSSFLLSLSLYFSPFSLLLSLSLYKLNAVVTYRWRNPQLWFPEEKTSARPTKKRAMDVTPFSGVKIQKVGAIYTRTLEEGGAKHSAGGVRVRCARDQRQRTSTSLGIFFVDPSPDCKSPFTR